MASELALSLLKTDLGYPGKVPEEVEDFMNAKLDAASARLKSMGLDVKDSVPEQLDLLVMYAAHLYRHRATGEAMPAMVRAAVNDCKVHQATKEAAE